MIRWRDDVDAIIFRLAVIRSRAMMAFGTEVGIFAKSMPLTD
jgi:hypothetical protein